MHYGFRIRNLVLAVMGVIFIMFMIDCMEPDTQPVNQNQTVVTTTTPAQIEPRYESCEDAPGVIFRGEPGYRIQLDRDKDGKACE